VIGRKHPTPPPRKLDVVPVMTRFVLGERALASVRPCCLLTLLVHVVEHSLSLFDEFSGRNHNPVAPYPYK
ncbi:hypothetical protein, partial [Methylacidimicrobium cyclopophantes]|uniref:hypothetical protein n=1 Tax=Methylacidimicrobium cyclopophantes TaxID=1041766 RepID=UPI001C499B38